MYDNKIKRLEVKKKKIQRGQGEAKNINMAIRRIEGNSWRSTGVDKNEKGKVVQDNVKELS